MSKKERKISARMLDGVERVGNALPSPIIYIQ